MPRLLVVVDTTVGLDETDDTPLVQLIHGVEPGPRRQRDLVLHRGLWRQGDVSLLLVHDGLEFRDEVGALAVFLHRHAAIFPSMHLQLAYDPARVHAPW